ncbi:MAG: hypothetical protein ACUZ77_07540, partial [Candidatus Brocadiales bacterium]
SAGSVNVGLALKDMDINVQPEGHVNIKIQPFKIRIPDVRIKFWFFPSIKLKGFDVMTEESSVQVQWDSAKMTAAIRESSTTA